jgi:TonB family protein
VTEYDEPRYYPVAPPAPSLPDGAVAVAPVVQTRVTKPVVRRSEANSARERFEQWVIDKHEGSSVEKIKTAVAVVVMLLGIAVFFVLLPPVLTELKYDWNKFAVAFNLPEIGDGRTGPVSYAPVETPVYAAPVSKSEPETSSNEETRPPARAGSRRSSPAIRAKAEELPSGAVFVPSFGASAPYRLQLPDGVEPGRLLYKVRPIYPESARARRPNPIVSLRAVVDTEGQVTSAQVLSGDPVLAAAALKAVRQWRYEPYRVNGRRVEVETQINFDFSKTE